MDLELISPALLDLFLKSAVLLAIAAFAVQLCKRAAAATRHVVWAWALAALLVLPVAQFATPKWSITWPATERRIPRADEAPEKLLVRASISAAQMPAATDTTIPNVERPDAQPWHLPRWRVVLVAAWFAVTLLMLAVRASGAISLRFFRRHSDLLVEERVAALAERARETLGVRSAELRQSPRCLVPLTWGTRRPVIMLPAAARHWPNTRLLAALTHEFAHVARRDHLMRLFAQIVCALYWPNPLVWLAARALRTAQEQACDDLVLNAGTGAEEYAAQLVDAARTLAVPCPVARHAVAMAQISTLERRIRAIIESSRNRAPASRAAQIAIGSFAVATIVISAAAQVGAQAPELRDLPPIEIADGQQVEIDGQFIELPAAEFDATFPDAKNQPGFLAILFPAEVAAFRAKLLPVPAADLFANVRADAAPTLVAAPRVTTRDGQRAVIEMIRERPVHYPDGSIGRLNEGFTLEVEPHLQADAVQVGFRFSVLKVPPGAKEPLTEQSFHRIDLQWPDTRGFAFRQDETGAFGGWETVTSGRKLLVLLHANSAAVNLAAKLASAPLPEVRLANVSPTVATEYLTRKAHELWPDESLKIIAHRQLRGPERKVTLALRDVSLAEALREVARAADLRIYVEGAAVHLAPLLPDKLLERANAVVFPRIQMRGVTLSQALDKLDALAREEHPNGRVPVDRRVSLPEPLPPLTIDLANARLSTALALVVDLSGLQLSANDQTFFIHRPGEAPRQTSRVIAPKLAATDGVAHLATAGEIRAAENIALDAKFVEISMEQLAAEGFQMPPAPAVTSVCAILAGEHVQALMKRLNKLGNVSIARADRVMSISGGKVTLHTEKQVTDKIVELGVEAAPTLESDGKTLVVALAAFVTERRADNGAPVFSTQRSTTTVSIFAGQTVALVSPVAPPGRAQLILVTTTLLPP